ncbi:thiamine phosphate synthase [Oceanobacillus piezotolerans]|uniref:Thiamine-phosphate synthase n=1 Tax=Oceanobacillus piezotolerans TaxID=2448030 RepID=A0A498DAL7_9BACI|nr:thiamine phosphate synthase [Oceanobacillus piezotolerans]RLL42018.1 thiamine phosphate synthase [Oceanobacillus piezotolerans]
MTKFDRTILNKYFIMGSQNCKRNPADILLEAIEGGISSFQFREKGKGSLSGEDKVNLGKQLRRICKKHQISFIINDDIELAEVLDVDGIHVGQDDLPIEEVRRRFPDKFIGLSISNQQELENSSIALVDYVGAGPIFSTKTKKNAKEAVGIKWIQSIREQYPLLPIVGIGGIDQVNAKFVREAGADGVAVISAITEAANIHEAVKAL